MSPNNILFALIAGSLIALSLGLVMVNSKAERAQAMSEAALQAAKDARGIAFEAKRLAEEKQPAPIPLPLNCDPENGRCHTQYRTFMGGRP